jgi:hypothetical protein
MPNDDKPSADPGPAHIQDFIFLRELSEVYLLLDHVSGRSDKSLINLGEDGPADLAPSPGWLEKICEIGWPPSGSEVIQAAQAATLLRAKDRLNSAAKPASGATIAFTLLVSGEDNADHSTYGTSGCLRPFRDKLARIRKSAVTPIDRKIPSSTSEWRNNPPSRTSLARLAYPGLVGTAHRFTWQIRIIIILLLLWLIFTCTLSWNVAAGHAIFRRIDALHAQKITIFREVSTLEAQAAKLVGTPPAEATLTASAFGTSLLRNCDWPRLFRSRALNARDDVSRFTSVEQLQLCDEIAGYHRDYAVSRVDLADWLAIWRWLKDISHTVCHGSCMSASEGGVLIPSDATNEQWGAILVEVLSSAVLPLCYGFLGAGAAVVRSLWGKMRDSLLSPRDLTLALGQLALGAVIGACIGLFVTPSDAATPGTNGFTGSGLLTASALSFIAGFGVEGVFVALESLIKRVFNLPDPSKTTTS